MEGLGRWEDAVADLEYASGMTEYEHGNVNQTINLASLYVGLDRPADALATIARVPLESHRVRRTLINSREERGWRASQHTP